MSSEFSLFFGLNFCPNCIQLWILPRKFGTICLILTVWPPFVGLLTVWPPFSEKNFSPEDPYFLVAVRALPSFPKLNVPPRGEGSSSPHHNSVHFLLRVMGSNTFFYPIKGVKHVTLSEMLSSLDEPKKFKKWNIEPKMVLNLFRFFGFLELFQEVQKRSSLMNLQKWSKEMVINDIFGTSFGSVFPFAIFESSGAGEKVSPHTIGLIEDESTRYR